MLKSFIPLWKNRHLCLAWLSSDQLDWKHLEIKKMAFGKNETRAGKL